MTYVIPHNMANLATEFNRYFNNQVQLSRDEKTTAYNEVMPILEKLAKYINKKDPRFGSEIIKVGSSFQGLKVGEPNEFDVNIPLMGIKQYGWGPYEPRHYDITKAVANQNGGPGLPPNYHLQQMINQTCKKIDEVTIYQTSRAQPHPGGGYAFVETNSNEAMWMNASDVVFEGDMIPILIKKEYKRILIEGIRDLDLRRKVIVDKKFHGPAITIQVKGTDYKIDVDMSVVVDRGARFPDYAGWPHRNTSWPSPQKKEAISNIGVSFVTKKDLHWMVSSALAEREVMRGIDEDGGCRKKCHRIMKKLNEDYWSKGNNALSSYALKNLLFWECEKLPNSASWTNDKMADRIYCMTKSLYEKICKNELNIFFIPVRNLLKKETEDERRALSLAKGNIERFLQNPLAVMQILNNAKG